MESSNVKGAALERAVHAIEEMVIWETPSLAKAPFVLEPNAILSVSGVRHGRFARCECETDEPDGPELAGEVLERP